MIRIQGHRERRVGGYIRFLRIKKVPSATPAELCLLLLLRSHKNRPELCLSTERQSPPTGRRRREHKTNVRASSLSSPSVVRRCYCKELNYLKSLFCVGKSAFQGASVSGSQREPLQKWTDTHSLVGGGSKSPLKIILIKRIASTGSFRCYYCGGLAVTG